MAEKAWMRQGRQPAKSAQMWAIGAESRGDLAEGQGGSSSVVLPEGQGGWHTYSPTLCSHWLGLLPGDSALPACPAARKGPRAPPDGQARAPLRTLTEAAGTLVLPSWEPLCRITDQNICNWGHPRPSTMGQPACLFIPRTRGAQGVGDGNTADAPET